MQGAAVLPFHFSHFMHLMMAFSCFSDLPFSTLLVWLFVSFNMNVSFNMLVRLEHYHCALPRLTVFV